MAGVKSTHPDYDKYSPKWQRCRDVICGQDAMQAAKQRYLPKLKGESVVSVGGQLSDYDARIKRSNFFNGTARTIDILVGLAFRKPPTVKVPAAIEPYLNDINLAGKSMEAFAKQSLEEALDVGRIGILVDHPPAELDAEGKVVPITVAVAEQRGIRPTLQFYTAESIRNWKFARINNAWVLVQAVLGFTQAIEKDEFTSENEDRYRVLDLNGEGGTYRQRVFRINDKGEDEQVGADIVPLMNGKPLSFIPFGIIGVCGKGDEIDDPPLMDLVDTNVAHFQVNSDYRHGLHFTGLPTLFLAGVKNDDEKSPIYIGGTAAITTDFPDAKGQYIEFTGHGLGAMENALTRLEKQMAALGAQMLVEQTGAQRTATESALNVSGENSILAQLVQSVSEALEWALGIFAQWAGASGEIVYQLNRDFLPTMLDALRLQAIFAGVQSGNISRQEAFELLQRGDVISGEQTYDAHQEQIASDGPPAPMPGQAAA